MEPGASESQGLKRGVEASESKMLETEFKLQSAAKRFLAPGVL